MTGLKRIQNELGVTQDGVFGPETAKALMWKYQLDELEAAHFLAQCAHESQVFTKFEENLNYSKSSLIKTFNKYFVIIELAERYEYKPEKIANRVYSGRMGNGPEESGDGWKHRGFGAIQLTGKNNHIEFSNWIGDDRIKGDPSIIAEEYPIDAAIYYFDENNIWDLCDSFADSSILRVSKSVNLGNHASGLTPNGLKDRIDWTKKIYSWVTV